MKDSLLHPDHHRSGRTHRMMESAKVHAQHGTKVIIVCKDHMHREYMQETYGRHDNLQYAAWNDIPHSALSTMTIGSVLLFADHSAIESHLGGAIKCLELFTNRRTVD
jgi:hypothetical protein